MKSLLPDDYLRTALRLLLSYFALALGGIALSSQETSVATLWFANAAAIVFLYRSQGVFWLGLLMLAGCANALANLSFGRPLYLVLSFLPGNVLEIAVGSWMLQRYCTSRNFLLSPLEIARTLLLAGVVPISVGSVVGAGVLSAYGLAPFDKVWFQWFEGAGIGVLATLPIGMFLLEGGAARVIAAWRRPIFAVSIATLLLGIWLALTKVPFPWIYVSGLLVLMALINRWEGAAVGVFLTAVAIGVIAASGGLPSAVYTSVGLHLGFFLPLSVALLVPLFLASVLEKLEEQRREVAATQAQLKEIYEKTPAMLHSFDSDGTLRFVSDRWLERMGYARDEVIGRKVFEFLAPDYAAQVAAAPFAEFLRTGAVRDLPLRFSARNGVPLEVEVSGVLIDAPNAQAQRGLAILSEVTQRNEAQRTLERQTQLLKDVVNSVPYGLVVYDEKHFVRFHNQSFVDILKLPPTLLGAENFNFVDLVAYLYERGDYGHQQKRQEIEARFIGAMVRRERLTLERQQRDGSYIELQAIPLPTGWIVMTYLDVTARRLEQQYLAESKERMQVAIESSGAGIWEIDLTTGELKWDAQQYRIYGLEPKIEDLSYESWTQYVVPEDLPRVEERFQKAVLERAIFEARFRIRQPGGELRYVQALGRSRLNESGDVVYMVGTNRDVTAEETYSDSLMQARNVARDAAIAKSLFLANMSHEIRTPMNAVLGLIQLLGNTALTSNQFDYVEKIEGSAKSLLGLLNDILDFSKIEAGKLDLEVKPFRIDRFMRELSVVLSNYVGAKKIDVLFDIDPAIPLSLLGDPLRLKQVLINLGGNAVKFTQVGQVVIALALVELRTDEARHSQEALIEFSVTDSGIGIAPENIPKMFNSFSQAEASTTRKFGGTGLGLAISKLLVELMGGTISLSSELHVGTSFSFQLRMPLDPLVSEPQPEAKQVAAQDVADLASAGTTPAKARHRVLLVDDNSTACKLMSKMMRGFGWSVDVAHTGEAALELFRERSKRVADAYTLAYLDWRLPGMDGWEVVQQMQQLCGMAGLASPKYVIVSANGRDALDMRPLDEQALINDFLIKPVTGSMVYNASLDKQDSEKSLRRTPRTHRRVLAGVRILVVEDNAINQQVAEELLNSQGAVVSIAADGEVAINAIAAAQTPYDIVLMDIQMPVMDGFEATKIIRQNMGLERLPIVGLTANAMESDREDCLRAGMNEHLGKPFDLAQLVSVVIRLTGHRPDPLAPAADAGEDGLAAEAVIANAGASAHPGGALAGVLDYAGALSKMGGNERLYLRAAKDLLVILPTMTATLSDLAASGNRKQCAMLLHTWKGNAATLGLHSLAALFAALEMHCKKESTFDACAENINTLEQAIAQACRALEQTMRVPDAAPESGNAMAPARPESERLNRLVARCIALLENEDFAVLELFNAERADLELLPAGVFNALEVALQDLDWAAGLALLRGLATPPTASQMAIG